MIERNTFTQLLLANMFTKQHNTLKASILGGGIALDLIHPTYLFTIRPDAFPKASGSFVVPYAEGLLE